LLKSIDKMKEEASKRLKSEEQEQRIRRPEFNSNTNIGERSYGRGNHKL
jgi:hypothetical protein